MRSMRDLMAALVAVGLLVFALLLGASLHRYRQIRARARDAERALGRTIVAELPLGADLALFTEDDRRFHLGDTSIDKDLIRAVRVLINGAPIAARVSRRFSDAETGSPTSFEDRPEGIERDRWDVAIETVKGLVLVECGAIRERVSQELARKIYDAVAAAVDECDRRLTTQPPAPPRDGSPRAPSQTAGPTAD
jgi:hypothetical protein